MVVIKIYCSVGLPINIYFIVRCKKGPVFCIELCIFQVSYFNDTLRPFS